MNIVSMTPIRNEVWCCGLSLRVLLQVVDHAVVLLHACGDDSPYVVEQIAAEHPGRVHILTESSSIWDEMPQRQRMLEEARRWAPSHLLICDCDEVISGNMLATARRDVDSIPSGGILTWPGYNLRSGINQYHSNGVWGNRWFSTAFADDPRLSWSGDTFHAREPKGVPLKPYRPIQQGQGGICHLWGASERRLIAKHALYKVTECLRNMDSLEQIEAKYNWAIKGAPYASYGTPATWTYSPVPESWWAPYAHLMKYLDVDAEPWQEAEVRRLVAEHGREKFAGLDLFEVA